MVTLYNVFLFCSIGYVSAQWPEDSAKYAEVLSQETEDLNALIETHADVELIIHPERAMIYTSTYTHDRPETEDYIVGIIIDPVRCITNISLLSENVFILSFTSQHSHSLDT
jgi:hypothetical protein